MKIVRGQLRADQLPATKNWLFFFAIISYEKKFFFPKSNQIKKKKNWKENRDWNK